MQLSKAEVASSDIIVTTPEKFDVVTRKSGDGSLCQVSYIVLKVNVFCV
jgi:replicative superfamily II helicase